MWKKYVNLVKIPFFSRGFGSMIFSAMIDIAMISVVLAIISQVIQNKFVDRDKMKKNQEEMKKRQEKMKELMKKQDQKSKNELEALEKEMFEAMNAMLSGSSKVMLYSLIVFFPAFALLGFLYSDVVIDLPFALPWLANGFDLFNLGTWGIDIYPQTSWYGWYFVTYLLITIVFNVSRSFLKKINGVKNG